MKVALVTGGFPDASNPIKGIFSQRAAIQLAKKVDLTVIHYRMLRPGRKRVEKTTENGYNLIRVAVPQIPFFNKYTICINTYFLQFFIKRYLKGFDVVHSVSGITAIAVGRLKSKYSFKHVCQFIGGDINLMLPALKKLGCIKNLDSIDTCVCNSNSLKDQLITIFPETHNVSVVYRGVNLNDYKILEKNLKAGIVFLFLGGLSDYVHSPFRNNLKGGINLMKAWELVDEHITDLSSVKLLFGGANTSNNDPLIDWKKQLKHKDKFEIIGEVKPENILSVYASSNVTIIPSMSEGFPNVGMESFASKSCVIGSDAGGLPELIDDKINGFIFRKGNEQELAEKIIKLLNINLVNELGKNAQEKAIKNYNNIYFADKYLELYSS